MPAPSIFDLYDQASMIEPACQTVLQATLDGVTPALPAIQISISRDSDTSTTPRYEITFEPSEEISQWGAIGQANPKQVAVAFNGILTVRVITTRPNDNARMDPLHGLMRGMAGYTFSAQGKAFNDTTLPYLQILQIVSLGMKAQLQQNKEEDISELRFGFKYAVRNDAWPATP